MWIFRQTSSQILYPPLENLTTRITIMLNLAWYVGRLYHLAIIGCDYEITNMALAEPNHIKRNLQHTKCVLLRILIAILLCFQISYHYVSAGAKEWPLLLLTEKWYFMTKIVITYHEKKKALVIENNFWNLRLKA